MTSVLFVCTGNVFRSLTAELATRQALGKNSTITVGSAGTEHAPDLKVRDDVASYLRRKSLDSSNHIRRIVSSDLLAQADIVLAMSTDHQSFLSDRFKMTVDLYTRFAGSEERPLPDVDDVFLPEEFFSEKAKIHIHETIDQIIELAPALAVKLMSVEFPAQDAYRDREEPRSSPLPHHLSITHKYHI